MQLGPKQKQWVQFLRDNPQLQMPGRLGQLVDGELKMCCLGACLIILDKKKLNIDNQLIDTTEFIDKTLSHSYKQMGLNSSTGELILSEINSGITSKIRYKKSLAQANDNGISWLEIADFIENNPEAVFTHSV
jgi:hypothetical protein